MAQGWGPGTREIQNASRDTIMERWGETPIGRGSTQIAASRGVGCGPPASSFFDNSKEKSYEMSCVHFTRLLDLP